MLRCVWRIGTVLQGWTVPVRAVVVCRAEFNLKKHINIHIEHNGYYVKKRAVDDIALSLYRQGISSYSIA